MPSERALLDTNAMIAWLSSDHALRARVAARYPATSLFTLGEMRYGIERSERRVANEQRLSRALVDVELILPDVETAIIYGRIQAELKRKGRPIPENDVWIAALAMEHRLDVVSRGLADPLEARQFRTIAAPFEVPTGGATRAAEAEKALQTGVYVPAK